LRREGVMDEMYIDTPRIGDILKEEYLNPLNLTAYRLAKEINVSTSTILDLIHNKRKISVEMALRFSKYFGNTSKFWLNLQNELDLREMKIKMTNELERINMYSHSA
jgi:antitoxin HigA-1